jgi:hypothetical protein
MSHPTKEQKECLLYICPERECALEEDENTTPCGHEHPHEHGEDCEKKRNSKGQFFLTAVCPKCVEIGFRVRRSPENCPGV